MTLEEQIKCVDREISLRKKVYPAWVERGKMNKTEAAYQIECMEAIKKSLINLNNFKKSLIS